MKNLPNDEGTYSNPDLLNTNMIATPINPESTRIHSVRIMTKATFLESFCLKLLCELNCKMDAPSIPQVKKHSLAAQVHDLKFYSY